MNLRSEISEIKLTDSRDFKKDSQPVPRGQVTNTLSRQPARAAVQVRRNPYRQSEIGRCWRSLMMKVGTPSEHDRRTDEMPNAKDTTNTGRTWVIVRDDAGPDLAPS